MRRKEPHPASSNCGKSLISTRIHQHQQRKMQNLKSQLPRSSSSPATQCDAEKKAFIMRSFSSPDPKQVFYRRNSDSMSIPKAECLKNELDSDLENYELFEESFLDIDIDSDDVLFGAYTRNPEIDEPKKVVATLLPGSGLQKISMKPISPRTIQNSRQAKRKLQRCRHENKESRQSLGIEELRKSPPIEAESIELDKEFHNAEHHLETEIAMATEESDTDTRRNSVVFD